MSIKATEDEKDNILIPISTPEDLKPKFCYMKTIIRGSKLVNMWPHERQKNDIFYHLAVWLIIVNCVTFVSTFIIQIKREYKNMDSLTELIDFVTVFISGTFRFIYIYIRGEKYLHLVSLIHNNFIHYSMFPIKNRLSLDKYYKLANKIILSYSTFTFFWVLQICLVPIISYAWTVSESAHFNETKPDVYYPVPIKVYVPFDYHKQPENAVFYVYQVIGFILFAWIYVVVDSFWYMVIILTIGQFALIKDSLNSITKFLEGNGATQEVRLFKKNQIQSVEEGLKKCIKHHQFTRKFVHMVDDIINPNILVDSLHAVISIGFILLDVTIALNVGNWNKLMYSFEYFITSITHMFFFDWLGNELAVKEEELADAIYEFPWYRCPSQKTVMMLVAVQSRRPYRLTGGRMYKLSLEFFASIKKKPISLTRYKRKLLNLYHPKKVLIDLYYDWMSLAHIFELELPLEDIKRLVLPAETIKIIFSYFTFLFQMRNGSPNSNK